MANKRQKKKNAKKAGTWEGQQYRGGRATNAKGEGVKNLIRLENGNLQNVHGVVFTLDEKKALEQAVNTANRKRKRMLEVTAKYPRLINTTDEKGHLKRTETDDTVASLQLMGTESDFILQRKTKSLQRFKSKEDYDRYMKNLHRVNDRDYLLSRIRQYKANHIKAILNELGDKGIAMKIRMMDPMEYMELSTKYEDILEIHYVYGSDQRQAKINQIRAALGMKIKEEPAIDSEFIDVD